VLFGVDFKQVDLTPEACHFGRISRRLWRIASDRARSS
jgi:hypothetical protein